MRPVAAALTARWDRFWFEPDSAFNLASVRVIVALHALWIVLSRDFAGISGLGDLWAFVPASVRWRYLVFEGHGTLESVLQWVAVAALLGAVIGVFPRVCCLLAGLLVYHLAPLETIIWQAQPYARGLTLSPILLVLLAFARSGDALTVVPRPRRGEAVADSWHYGWPLKLAFLSVAQIYLVAGYTKLLTSGPAWMSGQNIQRWLLLYNQGDWIAFHGLGLWIAGHLWLCWLIGIGTVAFELGFVLAVFSRRARRVLVPAAIAFHIIIAFAMNIYVGEAWLLLVFVNWDWVRQRLGRRPALPVAQRQPGVA